VSLFITGTDTGVGKSHIAARLLHLVRASGVRCAGMKAICCKDRRDAEALLAAGSDCVTIDQVNPVWLKTPAAPIVGTLMEKVTIVWWSRKTGWAVLITRPLRCEALPHTSSGALVLY